MEAKKLFLNFFCVKYCRYKKKPYLCIAIEKQSNSRAEKKENAQMAESVDALVSNTSGFTSIPVRPRVWVLSKDLNI